MRDRGSVSRSESPSSGVIWDGAGSGIEGHARRSVLPCGLRVLTECVPGVRSVAFGIFVDVGSRDEVASSAGASHFLEHLLFKGTARRSAMEISASLEAVGGETNAFTSKEVTCFYARVLDRDLPLAVDVVCDMVTGSLLRADDIDAERGVILEEIAMHDDDPSDAVHDLFVAAALGDTPLGRPILGTVESIGMMSRETLVEHYRRYEPADMVVVAAGNCDHDTVVDLVARAFGEPAQAAPRQLRSGTGERARCGEVSVTSRPTEQANVVLGGRGLSRRDDRRFALEVLSAALGGGMSSRLFQEVREKRGLAYSVYSFTMPYAEMGLFGIYAGCQPGRIDDVLAICREQLDLAALHGLSDEEIARGKGQLTGGLLLGLEDTGSRMSRLGKGELVYGEHLSAREVIARIDAVGAADIAGVAEDLLSGPRTLAVIGPVGRRSFRQVVA